MISEKLFNSKNAMMLWPYKWHDCNYRINILETLTTDFQLNLMIEHVFPCSFLVRD